MAFEHILYDASEKIATITLNRPDKLNAWTGTMEREVREAMRAAEADDEVRAIILTGAGRGFCAGADMAGLSATAEKGPGDGGPEAAPTNGAGGEDVRPDFSMKYTYFPSISKPIIAAVNGPAAGLGFVMMLYCDLRFAAVSAKFTTAFSRRGLIAEHGLSWMLTHIVGLSNSLDLTLSGRKIMADEALRMGLVNRVLPDGELIAATRAYATELATMVSPRSLRIMKKQLHDAQFQTLAEATEIANVEMLKSLGCEDFKEGVAHFIERRTPVFTGR